MDALALRAERAKAWRAGVLFGILLALLYAGARAILGL